MRKATAFLTLANARRWRAYSYLVSNACVLYGNAYQAASPALTAFGAESRPRSSPPTTLKLAFLYGNAFLQQILTAARYLCASFAPLCKNPLGYANGILLRSAKHAHERLNTSSPLHFLGRFCYAKTYLRNTLRRYVQQPLISAANSSTVTLVSSSVTLVSSTVTLTSCEPGSHILRSREPTSQHPAHHPLNRCYRYGVNAAPYTPFRLGIIPKPLFFS